MPRMYEVLAKFSAFIKPNFVNDKAGLVTNINVHGMIPITTFHLINKIIPGGEKKEYFYKTSIKSHHQPTTRRATKIPD